jgi:hypothetical protein
LAVRRFQTFLFVDQYNPASMTTVHSPSLRPQAQRNMVAQHGHSLDDDEDHVIAEIAEEAGISFEEVAKMLASQVASLKIGATIDVYVELLAFKRVRAALRDRAGKQQVASG